MRIIEERKAAVDMVPYFGSKYGLLVRKGVSDLNVNDLCGLTLAMT